MEEYACLCGLGSSRGCRRPQECQGPAERAAAAEGKQCPQKRQRPAETAAAAEGKRCPQKRQRPAETAGAEGKQCLQQACQGPAEKAAPEGKPALAAEKHLEGDAAARRCAGSGGITSPMLPPRCPLRDLPVEMLVEICASLPGIDLLSLAQACTKFHHILHTDDSIWRRRCREEYGVCENLQNLGMIGMSYREVYANIFPYRNILGLWQLDHRYGTLLNVVLDGFCITGWTFRPSSLNTHVHGQGQSKPSFTIRLTERKPAMVKYMDDIYSFSHRRHMQSQKDRFSIQWIKRDHRKDSPTRLRGERGLVLLEEDRRPYDCRTFGGVVLLEENSQVYDYCLTYSHVYLPPSHPDDLIRPGLFHSKSDGFGPMIAMLSFHGKYARVTKITGDFIWTLEVQLMCRIHLPDGEIFHNFNELSHVVQEIDEEVIREQQQENGTGESEVRGGQSPAQPSVRESGAAAPEEQPVPFVLPVGVRSRLRGYPQTYRMCFYGVDIGTFDPFAYPRRFPGVFILFDENHLGFIRVEMKYFILFGRVQNTFQHAEAPSPQAFLEILSNIQSGPTGRSSWHAL